MGILLTALTQQAVGGGMAASADTQSGADNGAWIMFADESNYQCPSCLELIGFPFYALYGRSSS